jgi:lysophospholipase L1-like esterase
MLLQPNSKLLMIGDSITDCERARPVGEGLFGALGKGYVALVDAMLQTWYPQLKVRVVNMGLSGNTARDLKARWNADVVALKPDYVSIMIGTNDVWRQYDSPRQKEGHVYPDEYAATLGELVAQTKKITKQIILMTPFYIEPNRADSMRARMDQYGLIVRTIAREHQTVFVDTQAAMDAILLHNYPATLSWDRVHPNLTGHMVLARAFLKGIGATLA